MNAFQRPDERRSMWRAVGFGLPVSLVLWGLLVLGGFAIAHAVGSLLSSLV